jgi:hypothetical protein
MPEFNFVMVRYVVKSWTYVPYSTYEMDIGIITPAKQLRGPYLSI